jgi:antirestriction protein ArdC
MARSTKRTTKSRSSKRSTTKKIDLYQELTDRIIEKIKEGVKPWQPRWSGYGLAKNFATGNEYSGINFFILNLLSPHPIPYYMTYKQAKEKGGQVKKGSKAERVYFYTSYYKDEDGKNMSESEGQKIHAEGGKVNRIAFLKHYNVFNVADIEGIEVEAPEKMLTQHERITACEAVIKGYKNGPKHITTDPDSAFYLPKTDEVNLPKLERFKTPEGFYLTMFHELTHSTGHESRLSREGVTEPVKFKSERYAREELIAEMGAAFLAGHAGIGSEDVEDQNAAYLSSWLGVLENDTTLIFKAAADAQKAVNVILGK